MPSSSEPARHPDVAERQPIELTAWQLYAHPADLAVVLAWDDRHVDADGLISLDDMGYLDDVLDPGGLGERSAPYLYTEVDPAWLAELDITRDRPGTMHPRAMRGATPGS